MVDKNSLKHVDNLPIALIVLNNYIMGT